MRKTILLSLCLLATLPALAIKPHLEWGLLGGIHVPEYTTSMDRTEIENRLGWQAGITTSIGFGAFSISPQFLYVRQSLDLDTAAEAPLSVRSQSLDVPVLLDLRVLRVVHLYAGPVFTVLNECTMKGGETPFDFGRIRPTLSYAAGANVRIAKFLMIDLRYNGQFRGKEEVVLPDGSELDKLRAYNVALSVGFIF